MQDVVSSDLCSTFSLELSLLTPILPLPADSGRHNEAVIVLLHCELASLLKPTLSHAESKFTKWKMLRNIQGFDHTLSVRLPGQLDKARCAEGMVLG